MREPEAFGAEHASVVGLIAHEEVGSPVVGQLQGACHPGARDPIGEAAQVAVLAFHVELEQWGDRGVVAGRERPVVGVGEQREAVGIQRRGGGSAAEERDVVAGGSDRVGDRNERIRMPAPPRIGAQDPHERPPWRIMPSARRPRLQRENSAAPG